MQQPSTKRDPASKRQNVRGGTQDYLPTFICVLCMSAHAHVPVHMHTHSHTFLSQEILITSFCQRHIQDRLKQRMLRKRVGDVNLLAI